MVQPLRPLFRFMIRLPLSLYGVFDIASFRLIQEAHPTVWDGKYAHQASGYSDRLMLPPVCASVPYL